MTRLAGLVVGAGGVRAGGDDGEVHVLVALVHDAPAQVGRHLGLGAPHQRDRPRLQVGGDAVDGRGRPPQRLDLGGVLDGPQRPDHRRGPRRTRAAGSAACRSSTNRAHVRSPTATRPAAPDQVGHDGDRVVGLAPRPQREHVGPLGHPGRLQPGHHQRGVAVAGQDQHGQPLQRHRLVAGQVGQVGADRQQQHVDADLGHAGADPVGAFGEHGAEYTDDRSGARTGRPTGRRPISPPAPPFRRRPAWVGGSSRSRHWSRSPCPGPRRRRRGSGTCARDRRGPRRAPPVGHRSRRSTVRPRSSPPRCRCRRRSPWRRRRPPRPTRPRCPRSSPRA